jgi:hypothetical protein
VKARKTSMIAAEPVARVAPSRRLWIEISITVSLRSRHLLRLFCGGRKQKSQIKDLPEIPVPRGDV